ncbi:G5 domain-containing protein [Gryllotalpicola koreensis]|uniref:G5 domain-containing protein n=1 Tax=Gryllotalpicola koreensis TaxID=993086 RepID=A0ABP8A071_9MICO
MSSPSSDPFRTALRSIRPSTWIGLALTALAALIGLSGGLWMMLCLVSVVVLVTAFYGWVFRRHTWLRLPRKRSVSAVSAGVALAIFLGSSIAFGSTQPAADVAHTNSKTPVHLSSAHSASPTVRPSKTPTPTPTHTPVVTTQLVTTTSAIPFASTTVQDGNLAKGSSKVTTAGVNGVMTTTYNVTLTDGKETSRVQVSQTVTTAPVNQVTSIGTYVAPAPAPAAPAPAAAAPAPASAAPSAPAPASAYRPGEFCSNADHNRTIGGLTCTYYPGSGTWHWKR